jgi:hypothetical protein
MTANPSQPYDRHEGSPMVTPSEAAARNLNEPWAAVVHPKSYAQRVFRISLHRRDDGVNYHLGVICPLAHVDEQCVQAAANKLAEALGTLHAIAGHTWEGRDILQFPDSASQPMRADVESMLRARAARFENKLTEVREALFKDRSDRERTQLEELNRQYETVDLLIGFIQQLPISAENKPQTLFKLLDQAEVRAKARAMLDAECCELRKRVVVLEKDLNLCERMRENQGETVGRARANLEAANKLVDYHRGMATEYRAELNKALEKGKVMEANERLVDYWRAQCFHGDPESLLGKMGQWAGDLAEIIGIPRRRWTCEAITERIHKLNAMAARDVPQLEGFTVGKGHPLDPTPTIVDGTGDRGTAPEAVSEMLTMSPARAAAMNAAVCARAWQKPEHAIIADAIEAYYQELNEERDGG